ncbi:hypothetical protein XNA1_3260011 [Xenorhabdus nematophila str. Anatoliense]|nr:hypothetical protein XNA1_3260011 [Xenorhabdus nematophila str. Anatoliense]
MEPIRNNITVGYIYHRVDIPLQFLLKNFYLNLCCIAGMTNNSFRATIEARRISGS